MRFNKQCLKTTSLQSNVLIGSILIFVATKKKKEKKTEMKINHTNLHYDRLVCFNSILSMRIFVCYNYENAKNLSTSFCCLLNEVNSDFVLIVETLNRFQMDFPNDSLKLS